MKEMYYIIFCACLLIGYFTLAIIMGIRKYKDAKYFKENAVSVKGKVIFFTEKIKSRVVRDHYEDEGWVEEYAVLTVTYQYFVDGVEYKYTRKFEEDFPNSWDLWYLPENPAKVRFNVYEASSKAKTSALIIVFNLLFLLAWISGTLLFKF